TKWPGPRGASAPTDHRYPAQIPESALSPKPNKGVGPFAAHIRGHGRCSTSPCGVVPAAKVPRRSSGPETFRPCRCGSREANKKAEVASMKKIAVTVALVAALVAI